jgi:hypothetical protein
VRIALARLAQRATAAFVQAARDEAIPLNLWERHEIAITKGSEALEALDTAIKAIHDHHDIDQEDRLFGARRLESRLSRLRRVLVEERRGLSGDGVAWLTDLFWHAVVFDSPLYPHVTELSLQVSLLAGQLSRPTRSLDPATVVARTELGAMSAATARAVERGFDPAEAADGPRRMLHRAIADLLHADYERWATRPASDPNRVVSMALTTTFDLEMERGLAAFGVPYEVAIPIYTRVEQTGAADGDRPDETVCWLIGRFGPSSDPTLDDLTQPLDGWRLAASIKAITNGAFDLAGPLLLKLNGSPSHALPDAAALGLDHRSSSPAATPGGHPDSFGVNPGTLGSETRLSIEHAVSLGEYDFLQVTRMSQYSFDRVVTPSNDPAQTRPPDGLPEAIVNQIVKPDRFWMLLGHRFGDWNSRIQLHTFIAHESRHTERGCAVARSFDTDRLLFLDWLGITRATGEMRQLIEPLQEAARTLRSER